jgi:eukaryotic-like serine/threonine-protein kinase
MRCLLDLAAGVAMLTLASSGGRAQNTATLKGHKHTITCLAYASDGKTLASGGKDGAVLLWNLSSGKA